MKIAMLKRILQQLHRDDRGNLGVLLLLTILPMVGLLGMIWNTGTVASRKIQLQAAADTAAYSAATWTSRANNVITGANMVMLRCASANVLAMSALETDTVVGLRLTKMMAAAVEGLPVTAPLVAKLGKEIKDLVEFGRKTLPAVRGIGKLNRRIKDLYRFEDAVVKGTPKLVERQRQSLEGYFQCQLYVTQPVHRGNTSEAVTPPVKQSNLLITSELLQARVLKDRMGWSPHLRKIFLGGALPTWLATATVTAEGQAAMLKHYILATHSIASEVGGLSAHVTDQDRLKYFTVLAVAHTGYRPPQLTMSSLFNQRVPGIVAYAQAETFNGNEANPICFSPLPWRLWSKSGWNWQPRLSTCDGLTNALRYDPDFVGYLNRGGLRVNSSSDLRAINLH